MSNKKYTPFFCEENIWHLLQDTDEPVRHSCYVLFLTNKNKSIALLNQKAAPPDEYIIWDYHVILYNDLEKSIYDFDTHLGFENDLTYYFLGTFGQQFFLNPDFRTTILKIPAQNYLKGFYSDRSHMLDKNNKPLKPFPLLDPISNGKEFSLIDLINLNKKVCKSFKLYTPDEFIKLNA